MELPEIQGYEDSQNTSDAPATRPLHMALRNSLAALLGIGAIGLYIWLKVQWYGHNTTVYWSLWVGAAVFAVAVCFVHALLAARFGGRRAGQFLKGIVIFALAGMLVAVWWWLRPKNGGV